MVEGANKIRAFLFDNFLFDGDGNSLKNDESLLDLGIIDSTGILELVDWVEEEFKVDVEDDELIPENLDSVDNLVAYIARKRS